MLIEVVLLKWGDELSVDYKMHLIYGTDFMMLIPEIAKQHKVFGFTLLLLLQY